MSAWNPSRVGQDHRRQRLSLLMTTTFWDIPYTADTSPNPLHTFDLFVPNRPPDAPPAPLICFVHGGAWRR